MLQVFSKISLLGLFLFVQSYNTFVWVHYEMNIEEITETFCVNKDKPELNCNGKCHMKKQLITEDDQHDSPAGNLLYMPEVLLFFENVAIDLNEPTNNFKINFPICEAGGYSYLSIFDIFHPPKVA